MKFSEAMEACLRGEHVRRVTWGPAMYVYSMPGYPDGIECNEATAKSLNIPVGTKVRCMPYLAVMLGVLDGMPTFLPGYTPQMTDMVTDDWEIIEKRVA